MRARIGAAVLAATLATFLAHPAAVFACQKCQFVEQGFQCAFSSVSCCAVINGTSCESGPCAGGCGALPLTSPEAALASVSGVGACGGAEAVAADALGVEGKRAHSIVLPARR